MWVIPADTKIIARNKTVFKNKIYNQEPLFAVVQADGETEKDVILPKRADSSLFHCSPYQ